MNYTDETLPFHCGECDHEVEGVEMMELHISACHPEYNPSDIVKFARTWADAVYEAMEDWNYDQLTPSQKRAYRADQHGR